jgi:hypothetical protein
MTMPRGGCNFSARPTARHAKGCGPVYRILADHPPSWPLAPSDRCGAEALQQCIPGRETIEPLSDQEMKASVKLKIGPMMVCEDLLHVG